ncbi:MAG: mannose-1-phosphate guanylyltransferase/mannose-6-phosphate isomerase [Amphiplicatus sp.]
MTSIRIQPVIMSGGAGTRLWPMSRKARPKQFLALTGEKSLFQETALRVAGGSFAPPLVIGGEGHAGVIAEQLAALGIVPRAIVTEPCPRNTAAVAAVAAAWTNDNEPGAPVLLLPADHHIADAAGFRAAVAQGADAALGGSIVTFGIKPTEAHTGYGYVERGDALGPSVYAVKAFREKPDAATAQAYLAGGAHYWNAGIFLFSPRAMLDELGAYAPAIRDAASKALAQAKRDGARLDLDPAAFSECPSDSIDYAVMEKTSRAAVVGPVDVGWNDIGSWSSIETAEGDQKVFAIDSEGCLVKTDGPFVGVIGMDDMIVVATGDAVLVAPKSRAQDVKKIVEELKKRGRDDLL